MKAGLDFGGRRRLISRLVFCLVSVFFLVLAGPAHAVRRSYNPSRSNNVFGLRSSPFSRASMYGGIFSLNRNYFGPLWQKPDAVLAGRESGRQPGKQAAQAYFMSREELAPAFKELRAARLPPPIPCMPGALGSDYGSVSGKAPVHFEPRP